MHTLNGMRVIIQPPAKGIRDRTLKERLFSRPWKPLERRKIVYIEMIEDGEVITTSDGLVMNQNTFNTVRSTLESEA